MGYTGQSDLGRPQASKVVERDRREQQLEAEEVGRLRGERHWRFGDLELREGKARRATPATGGSRLQLG